MKYAGIGRRVSAYIIDMLILLPVAAFCSGFLAAISRPFMVFSFLPVLLVNLLFFVYCVKKYGGSPGKLMLRMRITKTEGSPVGYREVILRHSVSFLLTLVSALALILAVYRLPEENYRLLNIADIMLSAYDDSMLYMAANIAQQVWVIGGFFAMLMSPERRAFHDVMAGTVVLMVEPVHCAPAAEDEGKGWLARQLAWLDRTSVPGLLGRYIAVINGVFFLGFFLFFFPIMPLCMWLDIEFSNLGPIATALWAVLFDIFVVTPAFVLLLLLKLVRALR